MAENQLVPTAPAKPTEFKTSLIKTQDQYLTMIERQMADHRIVLDEYQKTCVMNAISAINNVMDKTGVCFNHPDVDQASITQILLTVAALKLNASATPREVYFQLRNVEKTIRQSTDKREDTKKWMKVMEMGIEGDGNDALVRRFGVGVKMVYPHWVVRSGDQFTPPVHKGIDIEPPTWKPTGAGHAIAVVYPIKMDDDHVEYFIAFVEEVKENLLAHISNNLMNETFNICVDRFKASPEQKDKIAKKKREIMSKAAAISLTEILDSSDFEAWISPAWREIQSRERMLVRKIRNNIVKKIPKDFGSGFVSSQYESASEDPEEVTKDVGGDAEPAQPETLDFPEPQEAPQKIPESQQPQQPAEQPKPEVKPVEKVKAPKPHPQPQEPQQAEDPFAGTPLADNQQIGF